MLVTYHIQLILECYFFSLITCMMPPKIPSFNAKLSQLTSYTTAYKKKATQSEFLIYFVQRFPLHQRFQKPHKFLKQQPFFVSSYLQQQPFFLLSYVLPKVRGKEIYCFTFYFLKYIYSEVPQASRYIFFYFILILKYDFYIVSDFCFTLMIMM